ncbi:MAG TPA: 4-alpha-glucanotransferase, partial [Gammaproteobacteria bacterium]|nr:4-alpha-glucanotransferase [Gammaproteobacteria bacterium]
MTAPIHPLLTKRRAGVLLHFTSLPGPMPAGVLGTEALVFIDNLAVGGFRVWQFLPLGPTHAHGSPYESLSSFAGNPELLDLREFVACHWLPQVIYQAVCDGQISTLQARDDAAKGFFKILDHDRILNAAFVQFKQENQYWLEDYSLFIALREAHKQLPWWLWPGEFAHRAPSALQEARQVFSQQINRVFFEQFIFAKQWQRIQAYAQCKNILLFGDLPIYAAHDSADTWSHPELFTLNQSGCCEFVAGVPPDYFSETGQRWGNPLYHWQRLQEQDFLWWTARVNIQLRRMQLLRIDHFRGFESYWAIPGDSKDGRTGQWRQALGQALLNRLQQQLGPLPFVAEDLGIITPQVRALLEEFGLPGMKILQFAFAGDANNPYLPHNHDRHSVVYTGTHDNDTTLGWYQDCSADIQRKVLEYFAKPGEEMPWPMIRSALASVATMAIIPMQDLLSLGGLARMNRPGTIENNWQWRMNELICTELNYRLHDMNQL